MAWIDFQFVQFDRRDIYVPAMHQIEEMIGMKNLTSGDGFSGVWARIFANWITDEVSGILFWNQTQNINEQLGHGSSDVLRDSIQALYPVKNLQILHDTFIVFPPMFCLKQITLLDIPSEK